MCKEMILFRKMLDVKGIEWEDKSEDSGFMDRTHFDFHGEKISVINGSCSSGGEHGLLEVLAYENDPIGYLTAKEAFELIFNKVLTKL